MTHQVATDDPQTLKGPVVTHRGRTIGIVDDVLDHKLLPTTNPQRPPSRRSASLLHRDTASPTRPRRWHRGRGTRGHQRLHTCHDHYQKSTRDQSRSQTGGEGPEVPCSIAAGREDLANHSMPVLLATLSTNLVMAVSLRLIAGFYSRLNGAKRLCRPVATAPPIRLTKSPIRLDGPGCEEAPNEGPLQPSEMPQRPGATDLRAHCARPTCTADRGPENVSAISFEMQKCAAPDSRHEA
jgi:hypothetical protein